MHRQYLHVFKYPKNLITNSHPTTVKVRRNLHVSLFSSMCFIKQAKESGRFLQTGPTASSLFSLNVFSTCNNKTYFSQKISEIENATVEGSNKASNVEPKLNIVVDSDGAKNQSDASEMQDTTLSSLFENIDLDAITEGDEEKLNKFKLLMLEVEVMRQDCLYVPSKMSTSQWKDLFALQTRNQRKKLLGFLFKNEMKKLSDKRKKEQKRLAKLERSEENEIENPSNHLGYGFRGSTIFLRIYDSTINFFDNYRLLRAMMFGQDLILDCGFEQEMTTMENKLCCKQLVYAFAENRVAKEPFNLHFCNLKKDSYLYTQLKQSYLKGIDDPDFPINIHEEHYLDLFPKEKLVYLTPNCHNELKEFNPDDIYIIGAIVDKVNTQPLSMAKAKSEGLRMAYLPLDRYLDWGIGNKTLTLNQMVKIMHDALMARDWDTAFRHVPRRKIRVPGEPVRDRRKPWNRGTTLQPPQRFIKYY